MRDSMKGILRVFLLLFLLFTVRLTRKNSNRLWKETQAPKYAEHLTSKKRQNSP